MRLSRRLFVPMLLTAAAGGTASEAAAQGSGNRYEARLTGEAEVPPVDTRASGTASIVVDPRGHKLDVEIQVRNITDVIMAHFHLAPEGEAGPIVVTLYGPADPAGPERGVLCRRTVTKSDLSGDLQGQPLSALVEQFVAGNIYVNVHTTENPPGEIRGQVKRARRRRRGRR